MDQVRYESMVEEAIGIQRRTRREQVRLMVLLKEAQDGGVLEQFCEDINLTLAAAGNYLTAHTKFVEDYGVIPGSGEGSNDLVAEMWEQVFDSTADGRWGYNGVDREHITEEAQALGLKGTSKAFDIAKNTRSLMAAIRGDSKARAAAAEAITWVMTHSQKARDEMHAKGVYFVRPGGSGGHSGTVHSRDPWFSDIVHAVGVMARLREKAFNDPKAPPALMEHCAKIRDDAAAVVDLIKGRLQMDEMEHANG